MMSDSSDEEQNQPASDSKLPSIHHSIENNSNDFNSQSTLKRSLSSDDENDADSSPQTKKKSNNQQNKIEDEASTSSKANNNSSRANDLDCLSSSFIPPNVQLPSQDVIFNRRSSNINTNQHELNRDSNDDSNQFHENRYQPSNNDSFPRTSSIQNLYHRYNNRPEAQLNNPITSSNISFHNQQTTGHNPSNANPSRMHSHYTRLWMDQQHRQELQRRQYDLRRYRVDSLIVI